MKWSSFVSPYVKVNCPDGPRFILRNPEKAFSIAVANWDARIKAIIGAFEVAEANLELGVAKRFKSLVENLGHNYAELQSHYQAAYLHFAGNPCSEEASEALAKANDEIRRKEFKLREIEIKTEKVIKLTEPEKKKELKKKYTGLPFSLDTASAIIADIQKLVSEFRHSTGREHA